VAVDREKRAVVVAIRGTLSMEDAVTDGLAGRSPSVNVNVNVNELRLGFSNTTGNPEGILSHNNRKS
jgi:hypothetical protein